MGEPSVGGGMHKWYAAGKTQFGLIAGDMVITGFWEECGASDAQDFFAGNQWLAAPLTKVWIE